MRRVIIIQLLIQLHYVFPGYFRAANVNNVHLPFTEKTVPELVMLSEIIREGFVFWRLHASYC